MSKKKSYKTNIPRHELEALARCLLPDIQAFFQSEDGKREFNEFRLQQEQQKLKKEHKQNGKTI